MFRQVSRLPAVLLAAVAILSLVGCGGEDSSTTSQATSDAAASSLVQDARQAATAATSVAIRGTAKRNGRSFTYTMKIANGQGESDILAVAGNGTMKYVGTANSGYMQMTGGDGDLAKGVGPVMNLLKTHWLSVDPSALPGMAPTYQDIWSFIGRYPTAAAALEQSLPASGEFQTVGHHTVNGVEATQVDFDGPMPSAVTADITSAGGTAPPTRLTGSVFIATDGSHLPVAIRNNAGVNVSFSSWNAPVKLGAPPRKLVITLDQALASLTG